MSQPFAGRRERLVQQLAEAGVHAFLVTQPINVSYLTGFTGEASNLILSANRTILVSDGRFTTQLAEECPELATHIRPPSQGLTAATAEVLTQLGVRDVECESAHVTLATAQAFAEAAPAISWKLGEERVEALRKVKDAGEIDQIREAIRIAEQAFGVFRAQLRPDDAEKDLADTLEFGIRRAGGKCSSFPSIVAVGPRAALPHAPPTSKRVREAPVLLVDWGACGPFFYKSDLTRVLLTRINSRIPSTGSGFDAKVQAVYDVVLKAQRAAIAAVRPGVPAKDVDAAARSVIADAGFGDHFTHSIGHGLGMQVHELPIMRPNTTTTLEAGMVVTVEPGIYVPDQFGIRIEDDILVTPDGAEILTSLPRDFEANMVDL
ncbi:MAG: Xaa-Pro peptidase family protein [Gemmataceae bacterium]|nr:Xaa-Pro peptidase family protein [Gemmataceae bacterium]